MTRFTFLIGLLLTLVACSGVRGLGPDSPAISPNASPYQLLLSSADLAPGRSRLALSIWDGPQRLADAQALEATLYHLDEAGEMGEQVWEGAATAYQMGDIQYWVLYPEFPEPGYYGIRAVITDATGKRVENRALLMVKEEAEAPAVGDPAPRSQTRTLDDVQSVEELTSAPPYVEDFYRLSVAEAAESGKPSIIVFATPGYCSSRLCGPVIHSVEEVSRDLGDAVNVVHVEIYRDYETNTVDPAVTEWNLPSEPWVFVLDREGNIAARLDSMAGPEELRAAVRQVQDG